VEQSLGLRSTLINPDGAAYDDREVVAVIEARGITKLFGSKYKGPLVGSLSAKADRVSQITHFAVVIGSILPTLLCRYQTPIKRVAVHARGFFNSMSASAADAEQRTATAAM
jgi:hypothetical protein